MPACDLPRTPLDSLRRAGAVARWVVLRARSQPALVLAVGLLLGLVPLQARLSPLADIGVDPAWALAGAWVVPVGLLGMAWSLATLGRAEAFLELLPWPSRWLGEASGLLVGALGLQIPLLLGAAWGAQGGPGLAPALWLASDFQAAGLGLLLLSWKLHFGVRVGLFAGLLWVLPAVLPTSGALAGGLRVLADVSAASSTEPATWIARAAAVLGLTLASTLRAASRHQTTGPTGARIAAR